MEGGSRTKYRVTRMSRLKNKFYRVVVSPHGFMGQSVGPSRMHMLEDEDSEHEDFKLDVQAYKERHD